MIAVLYIAVAVLAGDALGRRWFRYETVAHRWATAVLIALPTASWLSYLVALPLGGVGDRLLVADLVAGAILLAFVVWSWLRDRRRAADAEAPPSWGPILDRWDALTIAAIALLVGWMMVSTYHVTDGRLGIAVGLWSDFGPTSAIAQSFAVGDNFPTEYPHYAGEPIRYHFLYYFQVGNLTRLGLDPATANNVMSIGSLVAMLVLVMALGRRLFRSALVGRIGALLFFFHGALSFIPFLLNLGSVQRAAEVLPGLTSFITTGFPWRGEEWGIWTQMVFLNQRHLASAIGILLVIVLFLLDRLPVRRMAVEEGGGAGAVGGPPVTEPAPGFEPLPAAEPTPAADVPAAPPLHRQLPRPANPIGVLRDAVRDPALLGFALCGALAGMLPLWNGSMYVAAVVLLGLWFVLFPNRLQMILLAVVAGAFSIPQLLWVRPGTMAGEQTYPSFFWGYVIENPTAANVATYLAFVFGPKLLLSAVALLVASWRQWRVFLCFSGLVAAAFLMQLSVEVLANHKFINAWLVVANLFAAAGLVRLWQARPQTVRVPARLVAAALAAIIVIGGVIDLIPVKNQSILEFGMDGDPLYEWVRTETDPRDVFLTEVFVVNPILLAGRKIYYGWPYYAWSAGYDVLPREQWYRELFANRSARQVAEQLRERGIDYVAIDDGVRRGTMAPRVNEEIFEEHFERAFTDDGSHGNIAIYRVPTDPAAIDALPDAPAESMYQATATEAPGSLIGPRGLALDGADGTLLVADTGNNRVQRFSPDGNLLDVIGEPGTGPGQFEAPVGVAVDPAGRVYVADSGNRRIQQFEQDGTFVEEWAGPEGGFDTLADVSIEGAALYAVDTTLGLARIQLDTGAGAWVSPVDGPGRLIAPTGLVARGGRVFVADMGSANVVVFDDQGSFLEQRPVADWSGSVAQVADVEVGPDGMVWATNPEHDGVVVFDSSGAELGLLAPGEPDNLDGPAGIVVRPAGSLFVANFEGNRISLLTQSRP